MNGNSIVFDGPAIRSLRQQLNLTQEGFAHEIGVTFATVNRWENNRTRPNKVAQKVLRYTERKLRKKNNALQNSTLTA